MDAERFEFALSQHADGTLSSEESAIVEERLRADETARSLLLDYQKLGEVIRGAAQPMPQVQWDRLAQHISRAIPDRVSKSVHSPPWLRWALAAMVMVAVGVMGIRQRSSVEKIVSRPLESPVNEVVVIGPQVQSAAGPEMIDVSVGSPQEADAALAYSGDGLVVQRPMIALEGFTPAGASVVH